MSPPSSACAAPASANRDTAASYQPGRLPERRLSGFSLLSARLLCGGVIGGVILVLLLDLPVYLVRMQAVCTAPVCPQWALSTARVQALQNMGLSVGAYASFSLALAVISVVIWWAVAAFIAWRRSDDGTALLLAMVLVASAFTLLIDPDLHDLTTPLAVSGSLLYALTMLVPLVGNLLFLLVFQLFPTGRFVPRWMRWLVPFQMALIGLFFWNLWRPLPRWLALLAALGFIGCAAAGVFAQLYRYRSVSTFQQRQQTKWAVFGVVSGFLVSSGYYGSDLLFRGLRQSAPLLFFLGKPVMLLLMLVAPLSFAIAILRYRLWDIDAIINKALVYGLLTALLGALYAGLIIGLESLAGLFGGQAASNPLVLVISTLAIAALFLPVRRRIQSLIDQRFYRRKYDAEKTLAAFSATLRNEVDLERIHEQLLSVVQETMQPAHVSLWLLQPERHTWQLPQRLESQAHPVAASASAAEEG